MLVDRAVEEQLINNDYPLLVVGAGAAGATAAIRGAQHGIRTMLIEQAPAPFLRQFNCLSRFIDPTQYDWPVAHWQEGRYPPWTKPSMPLAWSRGFATDIALGWMARLNLSPRRFPSLYVRYNTLALSHWIRGRGIVIQFNRWPYRLTFGMVVLSVGFGTEKCTIDDYSGFQFWDADDFERPNLGLNAAQLPAKVLISGGGDGALQDFLRIITYEPATGTYDKSPRGIYEKLRNAVDKLPDRERDRVRPEWDKTWCEVENKLQSAEDQANRAFIWGNAAHHDHDVHKSLHETHEEAVDDLWNLWNRTATWSLMEAEMNRLLRTPLPEVKLLYPCTHFSQCYGLNRFLVILFGRYLAKKLKSPAVVLENGKRVLNVIGVGHKCAHDPIKCHGEEHEVTILDSYCFNRSVSGTNTTEHHNVIIIRHGVDPPSKTRIAFPRQILPYHAAS